MKKTDSAINSYTFSEAWTANGQLVEFTCQPEDVEKIKNFLVKKVRTINRPATCAVENIQHGSFGKYTRFKVKQHKYAGGGHGFIEVLEIKNPPDNRCGFVVYCQMDFKNTLFFEFKTLEEAKNAFEKNWGAGRDLEKRMVKQKGYIRTVKCGFFDPWFYAVADQIIKGDLVFPDIVFDEDPVFRLFRKFIVRDYEGLPTIKTCIGCQHYETESSYPRKKYQHKRVFWDDGTVWDSYSSSGTPKPLDENNLWVQEAINKFRELITGKNDKFEIDFLNGDKFIGRFSPKTKKRHHKEGNYSVRIKVKKGKKEKITEGSFHFKPTLEIPTVEDSINQQAKDQKVEIISIESVVRTWWDRSGHKKWAGIYSNPNID